MNVMVNNSEFIKEQEKNYPEESNTAYELNPDVEFGFYGSTIL